MTMPQFPRGVRIECVAAWLIGKPIRDICREWCVPMSTLHKWTRAMGDHFKTRRRKEFRPNKPE